MCPDKEFPEATRRNPTFLWDPTRPEVGPASLQELDALLRQRHVELEATLRCFMERHDQQMKQLLDSLDDRSSLVQSSCPLPGLPAVEVAPPVADVALPFEALGNIAASEQSNPVNQ
eukprot:Skav235930  [mRNA]  locus=scaffold1246:87098:90604:- [translate_table: standard]